MPERIPSFDCCIAILARSRRSHPFNHIIGDCHPPAPSILDIFMIGKLPAVSIPKDASVSSYTITSPIVPASTNLSFQDRGRAAALECSIFKRGEDGMTGQDVIQSPRADFFTPHRVVPCASSLSLTRWRGRALQISS
jgi:hypothetical protein